MGFQVSRCDRDCRTMNAEAAKAAETMTARVTLHRVAGAVEPIGISSALSCLRAFVVAFAWMRSQRDPRRSNQRALRPVRPLRSSSVDAIAAWLVKSAKSACSAACAASAFIVRGRDRSVTR